MHDLNVAHAVTNVIIILYFRYSTRTYAVCDSAVTALQDQFQDYELDSSHNIEGHNSAAYLIQADYSVTKYV